MRRLPKSRSRPGHGSKKVVTSEAMRRIPEKFASLAARWRDCPKVKGIKAVRGSSAGSARTCPRKSAERLYFFDFSPGKFGVRGGDVVPQPTSPRDRVGGSQISRHPRNFGAPFCAWNFLVLWEPIRGIWEPRNRPARGSQISRHPRNFGEICAAGRSLAAMRKKVEGIKALRGISGPLDPWWSICNQNSLRTGAAQNFGTIWGATTSSIYLR